MSIEITTLKEFRKLINAKSLDQYENLPVVASSDDEGNAYNRVLYNPCMLEDIEISNDSEMEVKKVICIN